MSQRVNHRGRRTYNTLSNQKKIVKTPSGKLVLIRKKKRGFAPKCMTCKITLPGFLSRRGGDLKKLTKCKRRVARAYGGNLCGKCLGDRILDSFLAGEENIAVSYNETN